MWNFTTILISRNSKIEWCQREKTYIHCRNELNNAISSKSTPQSIGEYISNNHLSHILVSFYSFKYKKRILYAIHTTSIIQRFESSWLLMFSIPKGLQEKKNHQRRSRVSSLDITLNIRGAYACISQQREYIYLVMLYLMINVFLMLTPL